MDAATQVLKIKEFIEVQYMPQLLANLAKGQWFLEMDFSVLSKHDPDLADVLLDYPEDVIKAAELAIEQFDLEKESRPVRIRFHTLPDRERITIRNIRSKELGKFIVVEGVVRQKSDVRPQIEKAKFECPSCGTMQTVAQSQKTLTEPKKCHSCGYKGKFSIVEKDLVDVQGLILEESTGSLEGGEQPKRLNVLLKEDLVSPMTEKKTNPGSNIRITGIIKEITIQGQNQKDLIKYDLVLMANHVEPLEADYSNVIISKEEEKDILDLSEDPRVFDKLVNSLAPGIYGHSEVKEAILLQFMGGVSKKRSDGVRNRGDIHILLIGDPGSGKSQLLKRSSVIAPKGKFVSGKGASGAGLTAAVVKDEFLGSWALEAGALVLANKGVVLIDELDKMTTEDRSAMHEALEQQTISISKANIQATLRCETTVLAAANPKLGRFNTYDPIYEQINLPPALVNRFDLIFPFKDEPDVEKDEIMAKFILNMHKNAEVETPEVDTELLRKYIIYARQRIKPTITDAALLEIKSYYMKMRGSNVKSENKAVPISARQLEALIRLTEASAKARLSEKATKRDAQRAINLLHHCLSKIAQDEKTGQFDIDQITTGITTRQRSKFIIIRELIKQLEPTDANASKEISINDLKEEAEKQGIPSTDLEEIIEKLRRSGDIYEPRSGYISRI